MFQISAILHSIANDDLGEQGMPNHQRQRRHFAVKTVKCNTANIGRLDCLSEFDRNQRYQLYSRLLLARVISQTVTI